MIWTWINIIKYYICDYFFLFLIYFYFE